MTHGSMTHGSMTHGSFTSKPLRNCITITSCSEMKVNEFHSTLYWFMYMLDEVTGNFL